MNHLSTLTSLKNRYFIQRHGKSEANLLGIILSDPAEGVPKYGLTDEGKAQVRASAERALADGALGAETVIISSDFKRAIETARITQEVIGAGPIQLTERLRERSFGFHEGKSNERYQLVWDDDAKDPTHTIESVESVESVLERATSIILEQEEACEGKTFLLVSHGDTLQILQTAFTTLGSAKHRSLPHLETAEIRELK
jgi:glucosyl-3-phosphoglycerate phosphatase